LSDRHDIWLGLLWRQCTVCSGVAPRRNPSTIASAPNAMGPWSRRSWRRSGARPLADARSDFETLEQSSISDSPRQARTLLKLGQICVKLNDLERARQYIERASEIDQKINIFTPEERLEMARIIQGSGE